MGRVSPASTADFPRRDRSGERSPIWDRDRSDLAADISILPPRLSTAILIFFLPHRNRRISQLHAHVTVELTADRLSIARRPVNGTSATAEHRGLKAARTEVISGDLPLSRPFTSAANLTIGFRNSTGRALRTMLQNR